VAVLALLLGATALLLVVSGAAKRRAPEATVPALAAVGLGASTPDYLQRQPAGTATAAALLVAALTTAGYVALRGALLIQ
jgi:hypothetical protein